MKKFNVAYNNWGKILQISTNHIENSNNVKILKTENENIQNIFNDKASINNFFIYENKVYKKEGKIYLPPAKKKYTKISHTEFPDIFLRLIKSKKIIEININPKSLSMFYNRRMKDKFEFITQEPLYFQIRTHNKIIKEIEIPINNFLETFSTKIDISEFETLNDINIYTREVFGKYSILELDYKKEEATFYEVQSNNIDNPDITILLQSPICISINREVYGDLKLYSTEYDVNHILGSYFLSNYDINNISNIKVQLPIGQKIFCSSNITAIIKE